MIGIIRRYNLEIAVFVCGAAVMMIELAGTRMLSPYFGTSLYVWSSIIGVIMGSLSLGYWFGGRISIDAPRREIFSFIVFAAALSVIGLAVTKDLILSVAASLAAATDVRWGSFAAALGLFLAPNILLGMVSPYAARLKIDRVQDSGQKVGDLYAISTIGSILGTFAAGFWLIGIFSAEQIGIGLAVVLGAVSLLVDCQSIKIWKFAVVVLAVILGVAAGRKNANLPLTFDTSYARYIVEDLPLDQHVSLRSLANNSQGVQSLVFVRDGKVTDELAVPYNRYFMLGGHFVPRIERGLLIGGGTFAFARGFLKEYPHAAIDAVEIDPALTDVAEKYFGLTDDPRLTIVNEDGRVFLNRNEKKYDCIYLDAFNSMEIPFQLATLETAKKMSDSLADGGAVFVNIISAAEGKKARLLKSMAATYERAFPQVYLFKTNKNDNPRDLSNYVLVALKSASIPEWDNADPVLDDYLATRINLDTAGAPVFTDIFAPVEKYALDIAGAD